MCDSHSYLCDLEGDILNCNSISGERRWSGELGWVELVKEDLTFYSVIPLYCLNFLNGLVMCLKVKISCLKRK